MKTIKFLIIALLLLATAGYGLLSYYSESLPTVIDNEDPEVVANNMLSTLNYDAWEELKFLQWTFRGENRYVWDKQNDKVIVSWDENEVYLNLSEKDGQAFANGELVSDGTTLIDKAWSMWCNDSFWMFAPFKVFDPGTIREMVETDEAEHGLMVKYIGGGVTPGDSYLWLLDENFMPTGYKMWVSIIPVKGIYVSWEEWKDLPSGPKVSTIHKNKLFTLNMEDVKEGNTWSDFGYENIEGYFK